MKVEVFPSELAGTLRVPGSKSIAQRLVAGGLLAKGETTIRDFPQGADVEASLRIIQELGAIVVKKGNTVHIQGGFPSSFLSGIRNPKNEIHCGESGLSSRMFTPIASLHNQPIQINGSGSLLKRPFSGYLDSLNQLGVKTNAQSEFLPFTVQGPMQGGQTNIDGTLSSQFLTGLLFALPKCSNDSRIEVTGLNSKPYTSLTIEVLKSFQVEIENREFSEFLIRGGQNFIPTDQKVDGDWSSASFLMIGGALCSESGVCVEGISKKYTQADSLVLGVLRSCGVRIEEREDSITVFKSEIKAFEFDATDHPDLFPPLAALAAFANGPSKLLGVRRLKHKESNRAKSLQEEFNKANVRINIRDDEMTIYPSHISPAILFSHNDHRIVMAAAILGLSGAKITIMNSSAVNKSYPAFFEDLISIGGKISFK